MQDQTLRLREMFDAAAERYDTSRPGYQMATIDDLIRFAGLVPGSRVLEIGCGTGQLTVPLAERGLNVTAVELGPGARGGRTPQPLPASRSSGDRRRLRRRSARQCGL